MAGTRSTGVSKRKKCHYSHGAGGAQEDGKLPRVHVSSISPGPSREVAEVERVCNRGEKSFDEKNDKEDATGKEAREWNREADARTGGETRWRRNSRGGEWGRGPTRRKCCPARKNGYSFSNVPDAHAHFPAERMVRGRRGREGDRGGRTKWREGEKRGRWRWPNERRRKRKRRHGRRR